MTTSPTSIGASHDGSSSFINHNDNNNNHDNNHDDNNNNDITSNSTSDSISNTNNDNGGGRLCLIKVRQPRRDKRRHTTSSLSALSLASTSANRSATSSITNNNNNNSNSNSHSQKNPSIKSKRSNAKREDNNNYYGTAATNATTPSTTAAAAGAAAGAAATASSMKDDIVMDLSDPFAIIALAIRCDESWGDEQILRVPLESGRIHSRKNFLRSLLYLQKKTAPPAWSTSTTTSTILSPRATATATATATRSTSTQQPQAQAPTSSTSTTLPSSDTAASSSYRKVANSSRFVGGGVGGVVIKRNSGSPQPFALTPVIVSGFLALAAEQEHDRQIILDHQPVPLPETVVVGTTRDSLRANTTTTTTTTPLLPNSTELVQYCHSMRAQAILRVRFRNRRRKISKFVSPLLILFGLIGLYWWTMSNLQFVVLDLAYLESSCAVSPSSLLAASSSPKAAHHHHHHHHQQQQEEATLMSYQKACRSAQASLAEKAYPAQFSYAYHQQYNTLRQQQQQHQQAGPSSSSSPQQSPFPPSSHKRKLVCNLEECSKSIIMNEGQPTMPYYAMHTTLMQIIIPLEQVVGLSSSDRHHHHHRRSPSQQRRTQYSASIPHHRYRYQHYRRHPGKKDTTILGGGTNAERTPLQWLGETIVNGLVRDELEHYFSNKMMTSSSSTTTTTASMPTTTTTPTMSVLDVGCGIGGTLYALLPPLSLSLASFPVATGTTMRKTSTSSTTTTPATSKAAKLIYRGISISAPEINQAQRLSLLHEITTTSNSTTTPSTASASIHDIQFLHHSFDEPLPLLLLQPTSTNSKASNENNKHSNNAAESDNRLYMSMVAIESLSYSRNISHTLSNLASSLQRGGILIIVDDVLAPWAVNDYDSRGSRHHHHRNENAARTTTPAINSVDDPDDWSIMTRLELLQHVSGRSSLLTHDEWTYHLEAQGFVIQKVQDLGLEFDLPFAQPSSSSNPTSSGGGWWQTLSKWRRGPALFVLQKWQTWLESSGSTGSSGGRTQPAPQQQPHDPRNIDKRGTSGPETSSTHTKNVNDAEDDTTTAGPETVHHPTSMVTPLLAIVQLLQDFVYKTWAATLRNEVHGNAAVSYYIYVCIKT